jgi:hypothetical protein
MFGYTLETKYRDLMIFNFSFSLLAIENLQEHFNFKFLIFNFSFCGEILAYCKL